MMYKADDFKDWKEYAEIGGRWFLARPISYKYESYRKRIYHAWLVLIKKADIVIWEEAEGCKK